MRDTGQHELLKQQGREHKLNDATTNCNVGLCTNFLGGQVFSVLDIQSEFSGIVFPVFLQLGTFQ